MSSTSPRDRNDTSSEPSPQLVVKEFRWGDSFFVSLLFFQGIMFIGFLLGTKYGAGVSGRSDIDATSVERYYPAFQDVHIMMFVGFGFLMTFLRKYGYSAVGFNFLLAALAIQWGILNVNFFRQLFATMKDDSADWKSIELNVTSLIEGDFSAAAVLISFGAVLGKTSVTQLIWMIFFELIFYALNQEIGVTEFHAIDAGGSMYIHTFGAYFGLAVSRMVTPNDITYSRRDIDNKSVYHADLFSMIGTIFLWCYWPSFNGALAPAVNNSQQRAMVNTVLALSGSCIAAFGMSKVFRNGRFDMVDVQNATLAGGVAVGASADLMIQPWGAILIGIVAGTVSTLGFSVIQDFLLHKLNLHDTCGVNNLHGMPGVLGGVAGVVCAALIPEDQYLSGIGQLYVKRPERSAPDQALYQLAALGTTIGIAVVGGAFTGALLNSRLFDKPRFLFTDATHWSTPDEETPFYLSRNRPELELRQRTTSESNLV